ncbi:CD276 antigen homolog isoform X2 [Carassius gibelio]|uniref:CD276 antigen homolog isoform X2 n=1 Tax=Carassius gibelio TaxID=101364 RepID=UPI00227885ED|nr:CD276 antigen homolog isoform X2 [Carassius gibelio]
MVVRCWLIYLILHLIDKGSLQDPLEIEGVVGDSVILPCSYNARVLNPDERNAFWRYNTHKNVYDIENDRPVTEDQDAVFKDRIESFPSEYKNGNFSIRLNHLNFTDQGDFLCSITEVQKKFNRRLTVRASPSTLSPPKPTTHSRSSSMKTQPDGIVTFLNAVLEVFVLHYFGVFY